MQKLRSIILDDEEYGRKNLEALLEQYCPEVAIVGMAANVNQVQEIIDQESPDILFLDIEMPHVSGLDFLKSLKSTPDFQVIFVTAYDHYALQAFKTSAIDYLLKPVDIDELKAAVAKAYDRIRSKGTGTIPQKNLEQVLAVLQQRKSKSSLALPRPHGYLMVDTEELIYLEADSNYTYIHMQGRKPELISKTLKDFEGILDSVSFYRVHKGVIVNLKQVQEYSRLEGGYVIMSNGDQISIARRKQAEFIQKLEYWALKVG